MPLINFDSCSRCTLDKEEKFLNHPKMPIISPSESSLYKIICCGEGPGEEEDKQGLVFIGRTGQILREHIPSKWINKLYWTNMVRCRPPRNRTPTPQEVSCCSELLERDLDRIRPHVILGVGAVALNYFLPKQTITQMRGIPFPITLKNGHCCWFYPMFHPSYVMRGERKDFDTGELTNSILPVFKNDIKKFFDNIDSYTTPPDIHQPPDNVAFPKTKDEALNLFNQLEEPYGLDIETYKLKPYMRDARILTVAFSDGKITFAFPVKWPGNINPWGEEVFNTLLVKKKRWIAHHSAFEYVWVWNKTNLIDQDFEDTLVLARIYHQRSKGMLNLGIQSRIHLGVNVKELTPVDSGRDLRDYPVEDVLKYNALDAWACHALYQKFQTIFPPDQLDNYYRTIDTVRSTVGMEIHGLPVDLQESARLQKDLREKLGQYEVEGELIPEVKAYEAKTGKVFQLSSPQAVGSVLVSYCGIQLPKTESGNYSTDEDFLEPLLGKHELVDLTLDFREVQKQLTTYVEPILLGRVLAADGMLHPSYTTIHTATWRLSAENPNIQNFPKRKHKEIRGQIIAPPGHILAAFDYGRLEACGIAMASNCPGLKKAIIENEDIHYKWLYRIIDCYPPYMKHLARNSGETKEDKILKAGRTIIKTDFVFASFYGAKPPSTSKRTEVPQRIIEQILAEFWSCYPGAKIWTENQFKLYQETGQVHSLTNRIRNEVLPGNEPANSPIQGLGAEIVLEAQNALFWKAIKEDMYYLPRINVHDDLIFIPPDDGRLEQYIQVIGTEIVKPRFPFINVPLLTDCRIGYRWSELEHVAEFRGDWYGSDVLQTVGMD